MSFGPEIDFLKVNGLEIRENIGPSKWKWSIGPIIKRDYKQVNPKIKTQVTLV